MIRAKDLLIGGNWWLTELSIKIVNKYEIKI